MNAMSDSAQRKGAKIGPAMWYSIVALGLSGQFAWAIENQFMNTFVYDRITPDPRPIAWMVAASAITAALTSILMGSLSDRTRTRMGRRKPYILFGYVIWGLSTGLFVTSAYLRPIALAAAAAVALDCVMTFFGSTANDAAYNAWIVDSTDEGNRGRVVAVQSLLTGVALLAVYGGASFVIKAAGYEGFFGAIGAFVVVAGLSGGLLVKEKPLPLEPPKEGYWAGIAKSLAPANLKGQKELFTVLAGQCVLSIGLQVFFPYLLIYVQHYVNLGAAASTILMAIAILVGGILVTVPVGILADKIGRRPVAIAAVFVEVAGLAAFSLTKTMLPLTLFGILWVAAESSWTIALGAWYKDLLPEDRRGQFTGIALIFTVAIPMVIGPAIGSALIGHYGIPTVIDGKAGVIPTPVIFQVGAAISLLSLIPILAAGRKKAASAS
jgi:MFS family permease